MVCAQFSIRVGLRRLLGLAAMAVVLLVMSAGAAAQSEDSPDDSDTAVEPEGIEIDVIAGAQRSLIPLAVPDTFERGGEAADAAQEVQDVLRRNLELSGYFSVMHDGFFFEPDEEGMSAAEIAFTNWFNVGAQGLIKSSVRENDGQFLLDLRLYNVERGRQVDIDWTAEAIDDTDEIRGEVNRFINAVLEHFTGQEGVFGTRIAFSRRHGANTKHVYVMEMDGSSQERISRHDNINLVPTFGADGDVYFTNYRDGNPDLYVHRDNSLHRISSTQGQNSGAAYCDGKVAVTMSGGTANTDVYLIDPENGDVQEQLTSHWAMDFSPTWSPDCSKIAFISTRSGGAHIFVMNADGSDQRRLTFRGSFNSTPDWSPRGDRIVFSGRDEYMKYDLFTVDLDGNIERLTQDQGNNYEPAYSPDGRYIVYTSDRDGHGRNLWLMTYDGQVQNRLTTEGSGYSEPSWEH